MKINFLKMHGLGNDFIMIEDLDKKLNNLDKLAHFLSDRHFGIGADGIILIQNPDNNNNDFKMRIFNSDGSEAEMCGNGIRCFAHYLHLKKMTDKNNLKVETLAGIIKPKILKFKKEQSLVRVNMGKPSFNLNDLDINHKILSNSSLNKISKFPLNIDNKKYEIYSVSMGNPHTVIFVNDLTEIDLNIIGPKIETHPLFKKGTNVEFVKKINENELNLKVWERGAGITLACGTGACATAAVSIDRNITKNNIKINLPGGALQINNNEKREMIMTGPSSYVFSGQISIGGI
ncbi:MAG: diaminopimelate epimerase [Halanaerobiales bacterium]|nr:diaminopimelate epimerase [Halanaerobiales bacterium]